MSSAPSDPPIPLGDGWAATAEGGGWRGRHPDGRTTHLHANIEAVMTMITRGWLVGVESPIAPRQTHTFSRSRIRHGKDSHP